MIISDTENSIPLTRRENEILRWAARGLTTKEIAKHVEIAPRTVERHIENARLKMRARNRVHMISKAVASGILTIEDNTLHPQTIRLDPV
ncbi:LuxR C-terminal-related transcriptional regulator [Erythrobacter rubeus]|uniref:Helix-turn-helix transcriptional regulator n=1 Tax=Erythrobacter rubeus TaxID=2760803 RepID=A0ABR8KN98_9SPHN|nr:LuxR C-terminal-related transcriptional regulator [Erythrobacter rubeus]MBD2842123.1 helix-turn-helix transcriptional regulator [Erythrobacter rubeus]